MTAPTSLWEALGRPCLAAPLPLARSPAWEGARRALRTALSNHGLHHTPRSPTALWRAVHGQRAPPRATWAQLCQQVTLPHLVNRVRAHHSEDGPRLASWNVRWLRDPHSATAARKRDVINRLLASGYIVLLQETHWDPAAAAQWGSSFPACRLFFTPCVPGPRGGPAGGVATIVPPASSATGSSRRATA